MMISVVIGTFGDPGWQQVAERAAQSVERQTIPAELIHRHGASLHEARNEGAHAATGEFLVFLDADDELDCRYIEAMTEKIEQTRHQRLLYQPATIGITDGVEDRNPVMIPERDLRTGNYMVIGTAVERDLFLQVGGFLSWPIYEDWCLWIRCNQAGVASVQVPDAIYRIHVRPQSRNQQDRRTQVKYFNAIRERYYG